MDILARTHCLLVASRHNKLCELDQAISSVLEVNCLEYLLNLMIGDLDVKLLLELHLELIISQLSIFLNI